MTKNNTKDNTASDKVAKVSDQIKAATAEASGKSTAVKVNTNKSNKTAKAGTKNATDVKVNIKKTQSSKSSNKATPNKRILNVVEFGENDKPEPKSANKVIDGMVKPASTVEPVAKEEPKPAQPQSESSSVAKSKKKSAKKNKKKTSMIVLAVLLVLGVIAGVVVWMLNRNNGDMCTVKFESNGGSEVESVEVVCGSKVDQPDDPEKEGFEFREWAYRGKKFDFDKNTVDDDIILVAKWDASDDIETVTIQFDSAGGSEVEDLVIKAGTATMAPSDPTRDGYTFDGWYLDNEKFDFSQPIDEDIVLVAHWNGAQGTPSGNNNSRPSSNTSSSSSASSSNTQQPTTSGGTSSNSGSGAGNGSATGSGDNSNPDSGSGDGNSGGGDNSNVPNPDNSDNNSDQD